MTTIATCPSLAVITINYRSAEDTIECMESLLAGRVCPRIVVVDNDSRDGSVEEMIAWAEASERLAGNFEVRDGETEPAPLTRLLTIVASRHNGGFSSGNNIGLRLARITADVETFWLLNNDTVVDPEASLSIADYFASNPQIGIAGTQLRLYGDRDRYQLLNGMEFSPLTGAAKGVFAGRGVEEAFDPDEILAKSDFVCGASLIMSRDFLESVGLLEERFFLYYEELDLAYRGRAFRDGFVSDAIVYHKVGATAGSSNSMTREARSPLSEYHHVRSKMIFARKHLPLCVPIYFAQNIVIWIRRLMRGHSRQAKAVMAAILGRKFPG